MMKVVPDYYRKFRCIADRCRHNCCIGWEIDIDERTAEDYRKVQGMIGERLRENINWEEQPHFRLAEAERCPFLNSRNLCDIILTLGEEHICEICTEHPRFHNELPGRIESGIGLCCEEACRLILGQKGKVGFTADSCAECEAEEDEFIQIRDKAICVMQERSLTIPERIDRVLALCEAELPDRTMGDWIAFFQGLERLDDAWTEVLKRAAVHWREADFEGFTGVMAERQTEYEQLVIYLLYRHLANAFDEIDLASRAAFAAVSFRMIYMLGAVIWTRTGSFSFEDQVELVRLFSAEIEYSEENMEELLDEMIAEIE